MPLSLPRVDEIVLTRSRWPVVHDTSFLPDGTVNSSQKKVAHLNKRWSKVYSRFEDAWKKADDLRLEREAMRRSGGRLKKLESACVRLRDAIDKLYESHSLCEEAQNDESQGLPAYFMKRSRNPLRVKRAGRMDGCVDQNGNKVDCACPTGDPKTGCLGVKDNKGHELACTGLFEKQMKKLKIAEFFQIGGDCMLGPHTTMNQSVAGVKAFALPEGSLTIGREMAPSPACTLLAVSAADRVRPPQRRRQRRRMETGRAHGSRPELCLSSQVGDGARDSCPIGSSSDDIIHRNGSARMFLASFTAAGEESLQVGASSRRQPRTRSNFSMHNSLHAV